MTGLRPLDLRYLTVLLTGILLLIGRAGFAAPAIDVTNAKGTIGDYETVVIEVTGLPADATDIAVGDPGISAGFAEPGSSSLNISSLVDEEGEESQTLRYELPVGFTSIGSTRINVPVTWVSEGNQMETEASFVLRSSLITGPAQLFALLAAVVAGIYALAQIKALEKFFEFFPPLIWMYFVPMVLTTFAITPDGSTLYSFMSKILLPAILVLLIVPSDVRTILKLGPKAIIVMLFATAGIFIGAIVSFALVNSLFGDQLPADTWKGVGGLAGSWIGGTTNMVVVFDSTEIDPAVIGPFIIVDTILAYSWLGILVGLSGYQKKIDQKIGADSSIVEDLSERVRLDKEAHDRSPKNFDIALMVGVAFVVSQIGLFLGTQVYDVIGADSTIAKVMSGTAWGILVITFISLFLSTTPIRKIDYCGASAIGYIGLYLLITTYGARADLKTIFDVPVLFGMGLLWLLIHIAFLLFGLWITKAPIFLGATGSMANIGGTASAPVVAAAYYSTMAPVGLLMGILGGVLGTPLAFLIAWICRLISGQ